MILSLILIQNAFKLLVQHTEKQNWEVEMHLVADVAISGVNILLLIHAEIIV